MAHTKLYFENALTGNIKKDVPVGFSWTYLFFGPLVPLFRGDIKWFFLTLIISMATFGIALIYFMFKYNAIYIKKLVMEGYKAKENNAEKLEVLSKQVGIRIDPIAAKV